MTSTTVEQARERLIERIRDLAYLYSEKEDFTLASGRKSKHFFDMKPVMMDPECAHLLGVLMHHQIESIGRVDAIGGLELGAVPLTGIAIAKAGRGSSLKGFIVRKEPKGRGGRKTGNPPGIEGASLESGNRIVLLEDVTTTGGSALKAAQMLIDMGCDVASCITILDRQEGGLQAFEEAGISLIPLTLKSEIAS
ncbi:MAG: orotate phosphoribosyltransferase [Candidatus Thalassarchaeaceae archaeon]|jgi:orotate phosphoribosyltransferase|nr:orotate phosphoribosyltransferase [Candidatus Thalassarchaeaceae archaeon]|tara:strand:+ start:1248 stop:1832 length:585 start_codon:yes stop_codon:yes gene_type:complete